MSQQTGATGIGYLKFKITNLEGKTPLQLNVGVMPNPSKVEACANGQSNDGGRRDRVGYHQAGSSPRSLLTEPTLHEDASCRD